MGADSGHPGYRMREEALIEAMCRVVPHEPLPFGPGDDGAVMAPDGGAHRVLTCDLLVEDVHFLRAHPPRWLGWKLLAVNLSDVAAMGGQAKGFVLTASLPTDVPHAWWQALSEGVGELAGRQGVLLCGGDVVGSRGPVTLGVTAWGTVEGPTSLSRRGGRPGDVLMCLGPIGLAAAGLAQWRPLASGNLWGAQPEGEMSAALMAHLRPDPDLEAGPWALAHGAHAGLDLSDGIARDADRLAQASELDLHVDLDAVPDLPDCGELDVDGRVCGGEDYGLLVLVPPALAEAFGRRGFVAIGHGERPAKGHQGQVVWWRQGRETALRGAPHGHFEPVE